jgi:hypothetical protein
MLKKVKRHEMPKIPPRPKMSNIEMNVTQGQIKSERSNDVKEVQKMSNKVKQGQILSKISLKFKMVKYPNEGLTRSNDVKTVKCQRRSNKVK